MTPEQLAEIEQRWERWINPKSAPKTLGGDFLILLAEVRKLQEKLHYEETCHAEAQEEVRRLNRMVDKACERLELLSADDNYGYGKETWRKYLESEVADK